jgi:hypothetical protein
MVYCVRLLGVKRQAGAPKKSVSTLLQLGKLKMARHEAHQEHAKDT